MTKPLPLIGYLLKVICFPYSSQERYGRAHKIHPFDTEQFDKGWGDSFSREIMTYPVVSGGWEQAYVQHGSLTARPLMGGTSIDLDAESLARAVSLKLGMRRAFLILEC